MENLLSGENNMKAVEKININHFVNIQLDSIKTESDLIPEQNREWWIRYLQNHRERYIDLVNIIMRFGPNHDLLEIGSYPGHLSVILKRLGYAITCVDIEPNRIQRYWNKNSIVVDKFDVENEVLSYESGSFDICLFTEVLEHLRINPILPLQEIHRVLRPGGILILSTPNISPLDRLNFFIGNDYQGDLIHEYNKLNWLGHMGHIRLYSKKDITNLLTYIGFSPQFEYYMGSPHLSKKAKAIYFIHPKKAKFKTTYLCTFRKSMNGRPQ